MSIQYLINYTDFQTAGLSSSKKKIFCLSTVSLNVRDFIGNHVYRLCQKNFYADFFIDNLFVTIHKEQKNCCGPFSNFDSSTSVCT